MKREARAIITREILIFLGLTVGLILLIGLLTVITGIPIGSLVIFRDSSGLSYGVVGIVILAYPLYLVFRLLQLLFRLVAKLTRR